MSTAENNDQQPGWQPQLVAGDMLPLYRVANKPLGRNLMRSTSTAMALAFRGEWDGLALDGSAGRCREASRMLKPDVRLSAGAVLLHEAGGMMLGYAEQTPLLGLGAITLEQIMPTPHEEENELLEATYWLFDNGLARTSVYLTARGALPEHEEMTWDLWDRLELSTIEPFPRQAHISSPEIGPRHISALAGLIAELSVVK